MFGRETFLGNVCLFRTLSGLENLKVLQVSTPEVDFFCLRLPFPECSTAQPAQQSPYLKSGCAARGGLLIIFDPVLLLAESHKQPTLAEPSSRLLSYCPAATAGAVLV